MAKFNVGNRVMCEALESADGWVNVPSGFGIVIEQEAEWYLVRHDDMQEWVYLEHELSEIAPTPSARITPIEWFAPDECLPYDGADVYFVADDGHYAGKFYGDKNLFSVSLCYGNGDNVEFHDNEVLFWAYAPEVK